MLSNHNLELLMEKIFDNEETVNKIMGSNDMHELYSLCLTIQDGYSFEEFSEFFDELVASCGEVLSEIDEDDLSNVSGGANGLQKIAASALASLSVISATPSFGRAEAAPTGAAGGTTISAKAPDEIEPRKADPSEQKKEPVKTGAWRKFLNFLDRTTDTIWDNKGKLLLLGAGLMAGGYGLHSSAGAISGYFADQKRYNDDVNIIKQRIDAAREDVRTKAKEFSDNSADPQKRADLDAAKNALKDQEDALASYKAQRVKPGFKEKFPILAKVIGLPGAAVFALHKAGQVGEDLSNIGKALWGPMVHYQHIKQMVDNLTESLEKEEYDVETAEKKLDVSLKEMVRGQESAKMQIKKFFRTVNNARDRDRKGITPMKGAFVTIFNGPSGTGKTYTAEILTACLTNSKPYIISAADINKRIEDASSNPWGGKPSVSNILFTSSRKSGSGSSDFEKDDKTLSAYIYNHPKDGVVIIDEYDKIFNPDSDTKHPLDETFRNLIDKGEIEDPIYGKIDASGITFVLTTNETSASLKGKVESKGGRLMEVVGVDENGQKIYDTPTTDKFGTQTCVVHDPSFVQRLTGKICLFDALKPEDYTQIAKDNLGDDPTIKTEEQLVEMGGTTKVILSERISRGFDSVEISEDDYKMIGEFAASVPSAARTIVGAGNETGSIAANLRDALISKISDIVDNGGTIKHAKFRAVAKQETDASGSPTINFDIKLIGYNDEQEAEKG